MKPKPLASLNHFTVPVTRGMLLYSVRGENDVGSGDLRCLDWDS
jgi:hypothetical protein